ncbi:MAG: phage major capsid protein, partial [Oscillospiraceae bacterium]
SADSLSKIVATTTKINGLDYRAITSDISENETELKRVTEGAFIPQTVISPSNELVTLRKRGRMIVASYETIRFQRLDLFTVMLKQIGAQIASSQLEDAVAALTAGTDKIFTQTANTLTYSDLVSLWNAMGQYNMTTMIAKADSMPILLGFSEFKDAAAGLNFHATGKLITPLGAELVKSKTLDAKCIIGLDKNCALEKVEAGGIITDYDKLIDRQLERASVTCTTGFSKIFPGACKVLTTEAKV